MFRWVSEKLFSGDTLLQKAVGICGIAISWYTLLFFCIPSLYLGIENLRMIRYFDLDEASLIEYGVRLYQKGLLPTEPACGYPKFFNYLCGIFLYPYTFIWEPSAKVVALTFRSVNMIAMTLTTVVISLIGKRFFKSHFVGGVSAVLFATTPQFLWWGVNSRPQPVEILFISLSIYYLLNAFETRQVKQIWIAILWAGLATGTKLAGIFLVPTILSVYTYQLWCRKLNREDLKPDRVMGKVTASMLILLGCVTLSGVYYALFFWVRSSTGITIAQERGWQEGLFFKPFYLGVVIGFVFLLMGFLIFRLNRKIAEVHNNIQTISGGFITRHSPHFRGLFRYNVFIFSVKILLALGALFLLSNFDYVIFPLKNLLEIGHMLYVTFASTGLHRDSNYFAWFTFFPQAECMGAVGTLLLLFYLLKEFWDVRSKQPNDDFQDTIRRLILLSYPVVLLGFLSIGVQHRPYHYLLPAFLVLFILGVDVLVRISEKIEGIHQRRIYQAVCFMIVLLCIAERVPVLLKMRAALISRNTDPVVTRLAPWLSSTYSDSTSIMIDDVLMYIPPHFRKLSYWKAAGPGWGRFPDEKIEFGTLTEDTPEVFVRTKFDHLNTMWAEFDAECLRDSYSIVKEIPQVKNYKMDRNEVVVYERRRSAHP